MSDRKTKAELGKKYIEDLVHMNTTRLTYLQWSMKNIDPRQRTKQEQNILDRVSEILKKRGSDYRKIIDDNANPANYKRKRK